MVAALEALDLHPPEPSAEVRAALEQARRVLEDDG
jgi:hypothetical protein